jgi:hypothetical protein
VIGQPVFFFVILCFHLFLIAPIHSLPLSLARSRSLSSLHRLSRSLVVPLYPLFLVVAVLQRILIRTAYLYRASERFVVPAFSLLFRAVPLLLLVVCVVRY